MRILLLSSIFPVDDTAGDRQYILQQARRLARRVPMAVCAPVPAWVRPGPILDLDAIVTRPRYLLPPGALLRPLKGPTLAAQLLPSLLTLRRSFDFDRILSFWLYPDGFAAAALGRLLDVPVYIGGLGSDAMLFCHDELRRPLIGWALRRAAGLLAVSSQIARVMGRLADRSVTVIPNGVDQDQFRPGDRAAACIGLGLDPDRTWVISVGRMSPEKGTTHLVDAFAEASRRDGNLRLAMLGDGPLEAEVRDRIGSHGLQDRVVLPGVVPHPETPEWYRAADLFVLPSLHEGSPNALLEALACGTPVVSTRVGDVTELVDSPEVGLVVPTGDTVALASAISERLQKPSDPEKVRAAVRHRTWDRAVDQLHDAVCQRP